MAFSSLLLMVLLYIRRAVLSNTGKRLRGIGKADTSHHSRGFAAVLAYLHTFLSISLMISTIGMMEKLSARAWQNSFGSIQVKPKAARRKGT